MKRLLCTTALLWVSGCGQPSATETEVIVGATLINPGKPPLEHSVIVVRDRAIFAVGPQQTTPIPPGSRKTEAYGKWITSPGTTALTPGSPADLLILKTDPRAVPGKRENAMREMKNGRWLNR